ncbi:MAG TPA: glycosyltransferase, partial [Solirubrobacteraceae bacterium]|nr:glycosyltransferase [Solirubrobacteraceae bacterium]
RRTAREVLGEDISRECDGKPLGAIACCGTVTAGAAHGDRPLIAGVSVIIPTRDRPADLLDAVRSILAGDRLPAEIVVADQSTGPRAALPAGGGGVDIVHLQLHSVGVSRARNAAIAAARHDVLVFTDDDVLVERDWLIRLVEPLLAAPPRRATTGAVLAAQTDGFIPSLTQRTQPEVFSGRPFCDPLFSNNMALCRTAFQDVGTFDERFGAGAVFSNAEDNDLGYRLLEAGYEIAFVPDAIVYHRGGRRGRALARLDWSYGRGQGAFYAKHMSWSDRHMLRRMGRNSAYRLRRLAPALRGDRGALREGIYLAGLVTGALGWARRYGGR